MSDSGRVTGGRVTGEWGGRQRNSGIRTYDRHGHEDARGRHTEHLASTRGMPATHLWNAR